MSKLTNLMDEAKKVLAKKVDKKEKKGKKKEKKHERKVNESAEKTTMESWISMMESELEEILSGVKGESMTRPENKIHLDEAGVRAVEIFVKEGSSLLEKLKHSLKAEDQLNSFFFTRGNLA